MPYVTISGFGIVPIHFYTYFKTIVLSSAVCYNKLALVLLAFISIPTSKLLFYLAQYITISGFGIVTVYFYTYFKTIVLLRRILQHRALPLLPYISIPTLKLLFYAHNLLQ